MPRIYFATDIHGNEWSYDRLFEAAERRPPDAIVFGGDILKLPPRTGNPLTPQREWVTGWFAPRLRRFRACPVFTMMGNDDWIGLMPLLEGLEREGLLRLMHLKKQELAGGYSLIGYSCVPVTPFFMKDWDRIDVAGWEPEGLPSRCLFTDTGSLREGGLGEIRRRPTIEADLAALVPDARTVVVTHTPPHGTKLDVMWSGRPIGSLAVRAWIERHRPFLTLHGHVHESPQITGTITDSIGPTVMVNPGDSLSGFRAVEIDLEDPGRPRPLGGA